MAVLQGTAELTAALRALPAQVEQKVLRKSASAGASVVKAQVKTAAPIGRGAVRRPSGIITQPGVLRKAVLLKFAKERSDAEKATYIVTIRKGKGAQKSGRDAYYWPWVERGHKIVRKGKQYGAVPAHPFFVPAYRASSPRALEAMRKKMEGEMAALIKASEFNRLTPSGN